MADRAAMRETTELNSASRGERRRRRRMLPAEMGGDGDRLHGTIRDDGEIFSRMDHLARQLLALLEPLTPLLSELEQHAVQSKKFERMAIGEEEGDHPCAICFEDMKVGSLACALKCSHKYHEACLTPWLDLKSSCPLCRCEI